jgi:predicted lipid-binding transport protein (Tim44 family)
MIFLAMAIVPSIALVEIGVRGEISLKLMGMFSVNSLGIGLTSITVWFMNLIIPAIIGSVLLLNIKIFKKRNQEQKRNTKTVRQSVKEY